MRTYDLAMTHLLDADEFFIHRVQGECAARGLSFFLIEPAWANEFLLKLDRGQIKCRVLLNMHAEHHDSTELYHRLIRKAWAAGAWVIDPPELAAQMTDKAKAHGLLVAKGLPLPTTLVWEPKLESDQDFVTRIGAEVPTPWVIKPARGYGRKGVILDGKTIADLQRAQSSWKDYAYLVQERLTPVKMASGEPVYCRVYYCFNRLWLAWWNCENDRYREISTEEHARWRFGEAEEIVRHVAEITGMAFFSSELMWSEPGRWVLIDYVNDQCHLLSQTADPLKGVPDRIVAALATRLVEGAEMHMKSVKA